MNSKQTGDRTEARCLHALLECGYSVSIPFGDNDRYDLIVDTGSRLVRVHCKTAWRKSGTIRFNTHSQTTSDGKYHETTYDETIDGFLVYDPPGDDLFWVDVDDAPRQTMHLRYDAAIDHPSINWADEYRFDSQIP